MLSIAPMSPKNHKVLIPAPQPTTSYSGPGRFPQADQQVSPRAPTPPSPHTDTKRLAALAVYAETGNATEASRQTGIARQTIDGWVKDDGTPQLLDELRATVRYTCGWELASAVKEAITQAQRALRDGVPHVTKSGQVIYTRQAPKDAAITASILLDKWLLVSGALSATNTLLSSVDTLSKQLADIGSQLAARGASPHPGTLGDSGGPLPTPGLGELGIE